MRQMASPRRLVATFAAWSALALGVLVAAFSLPIDDFWLSLASARAIVDGADPSQAIDLTWTPMLPGALNPQWAAQIILGAPGSLSWALAINAALILAGLGATYVRVARRAGPAASAVAMILVIGVIAPHLLARAQSFSIALLPVALLLLETRPRRWWLPAAYAALLVAWANLHGGFVIGQVAALAYVAAALVSRLRGKPDTDLGILLLTLGAAVVAPLANPAGLDLLIYAYAQPGLDVVRQISVEWQPAWPWISVATLFWIYLLLLVAGRVPRRGGISLAEALLSIGLGMLAIGSIRQIPWFVLAMAPVLASDIESLLAGRRRLGAAVGVVHGVLGGTRAPLVLLITAAVVVAFQPVRASLPAAIARITPDAPVAIADMLDDRLPAIEGAEPQRILNEQVWGGYLSYRLGERIETAMDGRLEIRERATWVAYFDLLHAEGDPVAELRQQEVTWAALDPSRTQLVAALTAAGWETVGSTPQGTLLHDPAGVVP